MLLRTLALVALALPALALSPAAQDPDAPPTQAELEAAFAAKMSGAILEGHFTERSKPDAPLTKDRYTLGEVRKLENGKWRFEAKVEYSGRTGTFPIELEVLWAGDTPVITMTDFQVPFFGKFTVRLMVYGDEYMGVWDGGDHGGKMWGDIVRPQEKAPAAPIKKSAQWSSFRGPNGNGFARGESVAEWDVETGENVRWRVEVPGLAHSSPVIWGDRLYLTTAVRKDGEAELTVGLYGAIAPVADEGPHEFRVLCYDKNSGELLWDALAWEGEPEFPRHTKGSFAASTPATDGEHVLAFFGSEGLFCYSMDGELEWSKKFGSLDAGFYMVPTASWGFSSSPAIHEGKVLLQVDVQKDSFVAALDIATGEEIWRTARDEVPTWCTPTVGEGGGRTQVILNGYKHTGSYDFETGEPIWWLAGGGDIPVPRPVVNGELVYLTSAHGRMAPLYAVPIDSEGELELSEDGGVAWLHTTRGNYMQTPLVIGDWIFSCRDNGTLFCRDTWTGEQLYFERIDEGQMGFTASLVACGDKLYATSEGGAVHVMKVADTFQHLAVNQMGEECMASPAISDSVIYFRGRRHLTAVGATE